MLPYNIPVTNELIITFRALGKPHPELLHLDLSYNGFNEADVKIISE
jgi:hypothetical protein